MDKIKRMILAHLPVKTCNFKCKYCYITIQNHWNSVLPDFEHTPEEVGRALSQERLGGTCFVNLCASGETLLPPEAIDIIRNILEQGHYVEVVTNGSLTKRFDQIVALEPELLERLAFKFSFHYLELKRLNLFDVYFNNIKKIKQAGCSFTIEMMPTDDLEPYINEIKEMCMNQLGALCHLTIARNDLDNSISVLSEHSLAEYIKIWSQFDSEMLNFKSTIFQQKRNEFCYAGDWTSYINVLTGDITKCYASPVIGNIYDDMDKPLRFEAIGKCPIAHCYNGHAHLAFGVIPSLKTPPYANIRNRKCIDGSEWLNPKMKNFMSGKFIDSNNEYSSFRKVKILLTGSIMGIKRNIYKSIRMHMTQKQVNALKKVLKKI